MTTELPIACSLTASFHLLPGIDDGAADEAASVDLARAAVAAGTTQVAVTPHIDHQHGVDPLEIAASLIQLRHALASAQIPLIVHQGGEVAPTRFGELTPEELQAVTLGSGRTILLEAPFTPAQGFMSRAVYQVQAAGYRVLLGHPERSPSYLGAPERVDELVGRGVWVQVTAGAMTGAFGRTVQDFAFTLFERGLVHVVSSDAHDLTRRPPGLARAFEVAAERLPGIEERMDYWTREAPAAILRGDTQVTRPPAIARRRGLFSRFKRGR